MVEKKLAMLGIVNELLKTYFALNQRHLCKSLMNAVSSPAFLQLSDFPPRQQVCFEGVASCMIAREGKV